MLREGPIPRFLHGLIEYGAAVLFFAAPFLFSFDSGAAIAVSLIAGVLVLFLAAATEGPTSLINYVPLAAHVVLDFVLAILLIAMPFVAGFSDESAPTAFFIAIGALHLLVTIGTRFTKPDKPEPLSRAERRAERAAARGDYVDEGSAPDGTAPRPDGDDRLDASPARRPGASPPGDKPAARP